jgi:hypothetical protein
MTANAMAIANRNNAAYFICEMIKQIKYYWFCFLMQLNLKYVLI